MKDKLVWIFSFAVLLMTLLGYLNGTMELVLLSVAVICIAIIFVDTQNAAKILFFFSPFSYILVYGKYNIYIFLAVAFVLNVLMRKFVQPYVIPVAFVFVYCLLFPAEGVAIKLGNLIFPILLLMIIFILKGVKRENYMTLVKFYLVGFVISVVLGIFKEEIPAMSRLFSYDYLYVPGDRYTTDIERFAALTLDPNFYALLDCMLISVILFAQKKMTLVSVIVLLFLCISGFFTFSKSYIILLLCIALVYMLKKSKHLVRNILLVILVAVALVAVEHFTGLDVLSLIEKRFTAADDANDLTTGRLDLWKEYIEYIVSNTNVLIFGRGFNAGALHMAAHNSYIDFIYRFGICGVFLWILYFAHCVKDFLKEGKRKNTIIPMIVTLAGLMFLSAYHFQQMWACICIPFLVAYADNEEEKCQDLAL